MEMETIVEGDCPNIEYIIHNEMYRIMKIKRINYELMLFLYSPLTV